MNKLNKILLVAGALLVGASGWLCSLFRADDDEGRRSAAALHYRRHAERGGRDVSRSERPVGGGAAMASARPAANDGWGADPFSETPAFDFDEEKDARMTQELKDILTDLNRALGAFDPDREAVYAAARRLLAAIYAGGGDVPQFAKIRAIEALKWLGSSAAAEMVGFLSDGDDVVVKNATDALMEQLIDFNATEAEQLAIIQQLVKVQLSNENYESIIFTVSSFRNSNKVKAALAICDTGTDGALAALENNVDFLFDEAEAESIQTRADIVQYGKDHPDTGTDFDIEQTK